MNQYITLYHLIFIVKIKNNMRVCIIGSGLSALTLAKALVNENVYVDIEISDNSHTINKSRTIGISKSNFEFINNKIINIEKIIWKLKRIEIFTDNLKKDKILNFENNNDQLFSIIKNVEFYKILNKSLFKSKLCKKIKSKKKISDYKNYDLIIITNYNNFLTKKYFNKNIKKTYNSKAYTTIINHKKITNNVAVQIFTKKGPIAFLPISNNKTSIVYSIHNLENKKENNVIDLIHNYNFKYKINKIQNIESFDLKSINLRSYYYDNILAFGDLIHRIHPLAGQGFNMTIRDTRVLLTLIKEKLDLGLVLDSSISSNFDKVLRHKNYIFSNGIDLIHNFFNLERKFNSSVLSKSVQLIGKNPSINKMLIKIADKGINI